MKNRRATHPNEEEYHLDLFCWMAFSSRILRQLAEFSDDIDSLPSIENDVRLFNDAQLMDKLYWSTDAKRYCDYGLHSDNVILDDFVGKEANGNINRVRKVLKPPTMRFVTDVYGYNNLFPLLLRLLPPESTKLGILLQELNNTKGLWTPYGLRSLATWSPYYNAFNTKDSGPYWRGAIWINMNYLALESLKFYSQQSEPWGKICLELYQNLRKCVMENIVKQYEKTGFFWEHYNDKTGEGEGTRSFTGWTALVLNIMAENF